MFFRDRAEVVPARDGKASGVCNRDLSVSAAHEMGQPAMCLSPAPAADSREEIEADQVQIIAA